MNTLKNLLVVILDLICPCMLICVTRQRIYSKENMMTKSYFHLIFLCKIIIIYGLNLDFPDIHDFMNGEKLFTYYTSSHSVTKTFHFTFLFYINFPLKIISSLTIRWAQPSVYS